VTAINTSASDYPFDLPRTIAYLRSRKRTGPLQRVWFFQGDFFLEEECLRALKRLGMALRPWPVPPLWDSSSVAAFLMDFVEFQPDMVFSINHLGFDKQGWLTRFLEQCRIPAATWYVDNPHFIIQPYPANVSAWVSIFVWDHHYLQGLRDMGFSQVAYLPLATDQQLFRPYRQLPVQKFPVREAAFVGSSWSQRVSQQLAHFAHQPGKLAVIEAAARRFRTSPNYFARQELAEVYPAFSSLPLMEQINLEAATLWRASQMDRVEKISALTGSGLMVFGDTAWQGLLPDPAAYGGPINYNRELPAFYQCVNVNFNLTSLQMKDGLNQRVFDVPAVGGFLLTDDKEALWDLFEPGEVAVYRDLEEAQDKLSYYRRHPQARQNIATRARERILAYHTVTHRLRTMLAEMNRIFH